MKIRNRTGNIKPETRNAFLDQLAGIADGIICQRETLAVAKSFIARRMNAEFQEAMFGKPIPRRWWHRFTRRSA